MVIPPTKRQITPLFSSFHGNILHLWCWAGFDPWVGKILWRRKWQSTPVLLPGKSHGQRSLVGYSPWGREESDTTDRLHVHVHVYALHDQWEASSLPWCPCISTPSISQPRELRVFLVYSCSLPISIKVNGSCCLAPENLMFSDASSHLLVSETPKVDHFSLGVPKNLTVWVKNPRFATQWLYNLKQVTSVSLSFTSYKMGIMIDPSYRLVARIKSDKCIKDLAQCLPRSRGSVKRGRSLLRSMLVFSGYTCLRITWRPW